MKKPQHYLENIQIITSTLSILFLINAFFNNDGNWGLSHSALILWSVFFSFVFFIILIEKLVLEASNLFLVKITITLAVMSLVYICISEASTLINQVYQVDPNVFPFTRIFLSGIIFFKKIYDPFLFFCFLITIVIYIIDIANHIYITYSEFYNFSDRSKNIFLNLSWLYLFPTIIVTIFSYKLNNSYFSDENLKIKTPIIARILDFYDKSNCDLEKEFKKSKIIYLDPQRKSVLIDNSDYRIENFDLWDIITYIPREADIISYIPNEKFEYKIKKCNEKEIFISIPLKP